MPDLSKMTRFILGPSATAADDDVDIDEATDSDDEPTDIIDADEVRTRVKDKPRPVAPASVTSLEQRRRLVVPRSIALSEIAHVRPYSFSEAAKIGESYKESVPIILNMTTTEEKQAQKLIDFASGMAFATDGKLERITSRVFLLLPASIQLTQSDKDQLTETHRIHE
jgi:cell division inhibitor SepF